ncbi:AAA family ATPase [Tellurirhabdus bombi]|uniref:AAA family ATPase n=1 Tax=Tellurirhabdus bombi TaxID=2907205 RepID=UPI001F47D7F5|nr:AAA family ATPase [Tellurirhabdus bombi]
MDRFVISGGPGSGKSTLLEALKKSGFAGSEEVSRQLIQEQVALGSACVPWTDLDCFARLALDRMMEAYEQAKQDVTFFDRGIPDIIAYLHVGGRPVSAPYWQALEQYRYSSPVFMAPPWEAIYVNDSERWQTFAEATALYQALTECYQQAGYSVVELPKASITSRVEFVLSTLEQHRFFKTDNS